MTGIEALSRPDGVPEKRVRSAAEVAARSYAEHGWPVLPGSAFNGRRFVVPGTGKATDGVRPIVARNLATTDPEQAARYWAQADERLMPTVLLRSGPVFGLVAVEGNLAKLVLRSVPWQLRPGPVMYRGDLNLAYFLVNTGKLTTSGDRPGDIVELARGEWVAAPPSRMQGVEVIWWVAPESVDWRPAQAPVLGAALTLAYRDWDTSAALRGLRMALGAEQDAQA